MNRTRFFFLFALLIALVSLPAAAQTFNFVGTPDLTQTVTEGNAGTTTVTFTVQMTGGLAGDTVNFVFFDGTASQADGDFSGTNGTLTFTGAGNSQTFTATVNGDTKFENDENFTVRLNNPSVGSVGARDTAGAIITNDDTQPTVAISGPASFAEGGSAQYTVALTGTSQFPITVDYTTASTGAATAGLDYQLTSGTLTFAPGVTSQTVNVPVLDDAIYETLAEGFTLTISNPTNSTITTPSVSTSITDTDTAPAVSITDASVGEGGAVTLYVTMDHASDATVQVTAASADGTATTADSDYTPLAATPVVFNPGETVKSLSLNTTADTNYENDETFTVGLSALVGTGSIADATGIVTIVNNDAQPAVSIADASVVEGGSEGFVISIPAASGVAVTGSVITSDGTAGAADYTGGTYPFTIAAGSTSTTVNVATTLDALNEANETFTAQLAGVTGATIADGTATGTITDDDAAPALSINSPAAVAEGTGITFTVTLTPVSGQTVTVNYNTVNGTAHSGDDFVTTTGTLTFAPGVTTQTITVPTVNDTVDEPAQTFTVLLSGATNATISTPSGTGTINDNDAPPSASAASVSVSESGGNAVFQVVLSEASERAITVDYCTSAGTATDGADYTGVGPCPATSALTFAVGEIAKSISIPILTDTAVEGSETFSLNLFNTSTPATVTIATPTVTGTIVDDDNGQPTVSVGDATITETNASQTLNFTVTLSQTLGSAMTVQYSTADVTATAGSDYTAVAGGTVTIPAGSASVDIPITIAGDTLYEADETFTVTLTSVTTANAVIADSTATGTINNDDTMPMLSVSDGSNIAGGAPTAVMENAGPVFFRITLGAATGVPVTVQYTTLDGTAVAGSDYVAVNSSHTFGPAAGPQTFDVPVTMINDGFYENTEGFSLVLAAPVNGLISDDTGNGTITDDEVAPTLAITGAPTVAENGGSVTYTVTRTGFTTLPATFDFTTVDGTAIAGSDYGYRTGTATIPANLAATNTSTIVVNIIDDVIPEPTEQFSIAIANPVNATIPPANQSVTTQITDNDGSAGLPSISIDNASAVEGNSGTSDVIFRVVLSASSGLPITVNYATTAGTAGAGTDFNSTSGTLTFAPGETVKTVVVQAISDATPEPTEYFTVDLSGPTNATLSAQNKGVGTIIDDDVQPTVIIDDNVTLPEPALSGNMIFTVSLTHPSTQTVTVSYTTEDGTATGGGVDYTTIPAGTLIFNPGETSKQIGVNIIGDSLNEANETLYIRLTTALNATLPAGSAGLGTIIDNDPLPQLDITGPATIAEGAGLATYTVTLNAPSDQTVTVYYKTIDGSAHAGNDYSSTTGTLTFLPTEVSKTIDVPIINDTVDEAAETFSVELSTPTNATINTPSVTTTINDNDPLPVVHVDHVSTIEDLGSAIFRITLDNASGRTVRVDYATADGTAIAGLDYTAVSGFVRFFAGETVKTVVVPITGDTNIEGNEHFFLNLTSAVAANIPASPDDRGIATIVDDDGPATLSIDSPASVVEGNSITYTVTLAPASDQTVTVQYTTSDGSATSGSGDYTPASGTLTFAPGVTTQTVTVNTTDDSILEPTENLFVTLSSPVNAILSATNAQGTGTITDNDSNPIIDIDTTTVFEGNSGTTNAVFTVTLSNASQLTTTVAYATSDGVGIDAATTADNDYTSTSGTLTFLPNETVKTIVVPVIGDTDIEANENFVVTLSAPSNGTLGASTASGFILNDDGVPQISVNDVTSVDETPGMMTFTVTLSAPSDQTITVDYATQDDSATSGLDYTATSGQLTFAPGVTTQTFDVAVLGDVFDEPNETYFVNLSNAVNATISDAQGIGTITDDDILPAVSINDVTANEGNSGTTAFTFTLSLTQPAENIVTVDYATADGTASSASDYDPANGTVTFAPGDQSQTVTVLVHGDTTYEANETFFVNLSNVSNATIADAQGLGTITNDDAVPAISVSDATVVEGNVGTSLMTFTVTMSNPYQGTATVDWTTTDGTALTADSDYAANSGTVTFNSGETSKTVQVTINGDYKSEGNETFTVDLSNATNASIADAQGVGTIQDDDPIPSLQIDNQTVTEGGVATFTVTLSNPIQQTVTVNYTTSDNSAVQPGDYTTSTGTLTFNPGVTTQTFTVTTIDDNITEATETAFVQLSGAVNASIGNSQGVLTILDNEAVPAVTLFAQTNPVGNVTEGDSGTTTVTYTVTLDRPSASTVTVDWATAGGTATSDVDFQSGSGTLTFLPGEVTKTFTVDVIGDTLVEGNEDFTVSITSITNATNAQPAVTTTIADDDALPNISISDPVVVEPDSNPNPVKATFTLTLDRPSVNTITVDATVADGTATGGASAAAGIDYIFPAINPVTVTFAPGETTQTFTVDIVGDTTTEPNETFTATLGNAINANISVTTGTATIVDNDSTPTIAVHDLVVNENVGTAYVNVSLSIPIDTTVTVAYTLGGAPDTAIGGTGAGTYDYDNVGSPGTVTFNAGETMKTIAVPIVDDLFYEKNEIFTVQLGAITGVAQMGNDKAFVTIIDNEEKPVLSLAAADHVDPNDPESIGNAVYTVTLSTASVFDVEFDVFMTDGTAKVSSDYNVPATTHYVIPAGSLSTTVSVPIIDDNYLEPTENYYLNISNPVNAVVGDAQASGDIVDNDTLPGITVGDVQVREGDVGGKILQFTLVLSAPTEQNVYINYNTTNGTALTTDPPNGDYLPNSGQAVIIAGSTSTVVAVTVLGDTKVEPDENFFLNLLSCSPNAIIADNQAIGTILDDDVTVTTVASPNPAFTYETVTITSTINYLGGSDANTGASVDFYDGVTYLGTAPVSGDIAQWSQTFTFGTHNICGYYSGNANYSANVGCTSLTVMVLGDLDYDGDVDAADLGILANYLASNITQGPAPFDAPLTAADVDRDTDVDAADLGILANYLAGNIASLPYP